MRAIAIACTALAAVGLGACGAGSGSGTSTGHAAPRTPIALDDAIARFSDPAAIDAASARRGHGDGAARRAPAVAETPAVTRDGEERAHASVGTSTRRVDVRLHEADLENSLRMLADAARVPIVMDGDVEGTVTIELRRVDPIRALAAIARAHGASVERENGVLVVRGH